jgi:hypothetical protein
MPGIDRELDVFARWPRTIENWQFYPRESKAPRAASIEVRLRRPMYAGVPTGLPWVCVNSDSEALTEIRMYFGGILGTIILIALIVWVVRRV